MAGYYVHVLRRQFAFDNVEIGATHATGADTQQNKARPRLRLCNVGDLEGVLGNRSG